MKTFKILFLLLLMAGSQVCFAQADLWSRSGNSLTGTEKFGSTNAKPVNFFTNNIQRMTLTSGGLLGIGAKAPKSTVHIIRGAGANVVIYDPNLTLVTENADNNFIGVFAPDFKQSGILFGNTSGESGILYNMLNAPHGMQFRTNSRIAMTVNQLGNLGIGTESPNAMLHVLKGTASLLPPNPNSVIIAENHDDAFISVLSPLERRSGILFGNNLNNADGGILFNDGATKRGLQFRTGNNSTRMVVTSSGLVGFGTLQPAAALHVVAGSANSTPLAGATIVTERNSNNFVNILTPNSGTSGVIFGNPQNNADGGVIYNSSETIRGLQFNTGGNSTRMVVAGNGFVGIGTKTPASELHVVHSNTNFSSAGLRIQNEVGTYWVLHTDNVSNLDLSANGQFMGAFAHDGGEYFATSDARVKKDIVKAPDVLNKIMQLNVKQYRFLQEGPADKVHYGMLAQDVEKLFPEIILHKTEDGADRYLVNQSAYGVIAIKAIQELKGIIEGQRADIEELKGIIKQLKAKEEPSTQTHISNNPVALSADKRIGVAGAKLYQNAPNPFNSQTTIYYYIPRLRGKATIDVFSFGGQLIKTYPVTGSGSGQLIIKAGELAVGSYQYVLSIDGLKVDAKQMMVIK